jgi:branched-chain amino acid transport system permease protein
VAVIDDAVDERDGGIPRPEVIARIKTGNLLVSVVVLVLLVAVPWGSPYWQSLVTIASIYAIVNMSWTVLLGFGGIFAFGQMGFFATGAYAAALINVHLGLTPWLTLFLGALAAGLVGAVIGGISMRLHGPYVVLFTLAFQLTLWVLITTDTSTFTGGAAGLRGVEPFSHGSFLGEDSTFAYALAVVLAVGTFLLLFLLSRSPLGLAMRAIRDSRSAAASVGMSEFQHRVILFVVSAMFTGLAGAFNAHWLGVAAPSSLEITLLINLLAMIVVGGLGSLVGPVIGTALLVYVDSRLASTAEYRQLIWGGVIVLAVMMMPGGVFGLLQAAKRWAERGIEELLSGANDEDVGDSDDSSRRSSAVA